MCDATLQQNMYTQVTKIKENTDKSLEHDQAIMAFVFFVFVLQFLILAFLFMIYKIMPRNTSSAPKMMGMSPMPPPPPPVISMPGPMPSMAPPMGRQMMAQGTMPTMGGQRM